MKTETRQKYRHYLYAFDKQLSHIYKHTIVASKCSGWAIVTGLCPSSCVVRRPSTFLLIFFSDTANWILTILHRNGPWVVPYQSCSNGFDWLNKQITGSKQRFQNAILKNLLVWNYKVQSFHMWCIAPSRSPLPKLFKLWSWGQNWPRPGGHNLTLNYIRKCSNGIFFWIAYGNVTKLNRNGPWVVSYQQCSNGSDWLHM